MSKSVSIQQDKYTLLFKILAWVLIAFQIILIAVFWAKLDDTIAIHFNASGEPDNYGSKIFLWILPGINMVLNLFIFEIARYPKMFNYPVQITDENREFQYQLAYKALMSVCAGTSALFLIITWDMIRSGLYGSISHGIWLLVEIFVLTILPIIIYIYLAKRYARSEK